MTDAQAVKTVAYSSGTDLEAEHVHNVYENIASHFSSTRYKPWPRVVHFLQSLDSGSVGIDLGCGNGKNLHVNPSVYIVASDRSVNLTKIAALSAEQGKHSNLHDRHSIASSSYVSLLVADAIDLPHPPNSFDFAISVAVIHHFSTAERRVAAVKAILQCLRQRQRSETSQQQAGRVLIVVWALEQTASSRRSWREGMEQDVMVPWIFKSGAKTGEQHTFHRYYHLYREGELEDNVQTAGGTVLESGYEKDNWWVVATPGDLVQHS